jgi:hypothetical protein
VCTEGKLKSGFGQHTLLSSLFFTLSLSLPFLVNDIAMREEKLRYSSVTTAGRRGCVKKRTKQQVVVEEQRRVSAQERPKF